MEFIKTDHFLATNKISIHLKMQTLFKPYFLDDNTTGPQISNKRIPLTTTNTKTYYEMGKNKQTNTIFNNFRVKKEIIKTIMTNHLEGTGRALQIETRGIQSALCKEEN